MRSPKVRGHPRAHALGCPSLKRTHSYGNLRYNIVSHEFVSSLPQRAMHLQLLVFMFMNGNSMDLVESRMAMVSGNNECMDRRSYLYCVHSMCAWHAWNRAWLKFGTNEGP